MFAVRTLSTKVLASALLAVGAAGTAPAYTPPGAKKPVQTSPTFNDPASVQPAKAQPIRLGVQVFPNSGGGLFVAGTLANMPAQQVGLERGDVLLTANGTFLSAGSDLGTALDGAELNGGHVSLVIRSGTDGNYYQIDADITAGVQYSVKGAVASAPAAPVVRNVTKKKVAAPR